MKLNQKTTYLLIAMTFALLPVSAHAEAQPESLYLNQFEKPEAATVEAAKKGLEEYRNTRPYKKNGKLKQTKKKEHLKQIGIQNTKVK